MICPWWSPCPAPKDYAQYNVREHKREEPGPIQQPAMHDVARALNPVGSFDMAIYYLTVVTTERDSYASFPIA